MFSLDSLEAATQCGSRWRFALHCPSEPMCENLAKACWQLFLREATAVRSKHPVLSRKPLNSQCNHSFSDSNSNNKLAKATLAQPLQRYANHPNSSADIRKHKTCTTAP